MSGDPNDIYPVFYATRTPAMIGEDGNQFITYDSPMKLNNGDGMDAPSGIFYAPISGYYYLSFTGVLQKENEQATVQFVKVNSSGIMIVVASGHANASQVKGSVFPINLSMGVFLLQNDMIFARMFGNFGVSNPVGQAPYQGSLITFIGFLVQAAPGSNDFKVIIFGCFSCIIANKLLIESNRIIIKFLPEIFLYRPLTTHQLI